MILFVNDNTGILFLSKLTTGVKHFISGTIDALSVVTGAVKGRGVLVGVINANSVLTGSMKGHGLLSGIINTQSVASARMIAYAKISGTINTFSRVLGGLNTQIIIEIIRIKSTVTRILKINSKL
jgi:hypothetical protein